MKKNDEKCMKKYNEKCMKKYNEKCMKKQQIMHEKGCWTGADSGKSTEISHVL